MNPVKTYPMSSPCPKREGCVVVENHDAGVYEEYENMLHYWIHTTDRLKASGASHQKISGFKRRIFGRKNLSQILAAWIKDEAGTRS